MAKGFMAACSTYFGKKEGQSIVDFKREVDALTPKDKEDLAPLLSAALGEEVVTTPLAPGAAA